MNRKTLKKRSLSLLLCVVMIVSIIPTWAFADGGISAGSGGGSSSGSGGISAGSTPQIGVYVQGTEPKLAVGVYDLDGDGTNDDAYEIATAAQLEWFSQHVNSGNGNVNAVLVADIDLSGTVHTPIGVKGSAFEGFFEGRGYTVSNMIIASVQNGYGTGNLTYNYQGLFGVTVGATVRNFTVEGEITLAANGQNYVGGAVGHAYGGSKIENVISYVRITDGDSVYSNIEHIGGVVGCLGATVNSQDSSAVAQNCRYYGEINIDKGSCVGGIAGKAMKSSSVLGCFNYGTVGNNEIGHIAGIVGSAQTGALIQDCANYGAITAHYHDCVGGIAGYANENVVIKDCANFGAVTSQKGSNGVTVYVGGILGYINNGSFGGLTGCFNFGKVTDADGSYAYTGAIIGWLRNADTSKISGNHWYTASSNTAYGSSGRSAEAPTAATIFDSSHHNMTEGWYIVTGTRDCSWNITTTGNVNLVLADGAALNVNGLHSITVNADSSFTVWAQSEPVYNADGSIDETSTVTGRLTVSNNGGDNAAGIGSFKGSEAGKITINGGIITTSGHYSAGIGGNAPNGIIINGGYVDAYGDGGAGIGAGKDGDSGSVASITINGGRIKAWSSSYGAGIGGYEGREAGSITINGGSIVAGSYGYGAGIGSGWNTSVGTVTINAGSVTAKGSDGAGIGGSGSGGYSSIVINGGKVTAEGGKHGTGIGAGRRQGGVGSITINGGTVNATGGTSENSLDVAGIGASYSSAAQRITINGGNVTAKSLYKGAGIGGVYNKDVSADIIINGGIINATGDNFVAIGYIGNTDTTATPAVLRITGGSITANAHEGIGFYAIRAIDRIEITGFDEIVISAGSGKTALNGNLTIADGIKFRAATGDTLETLTPRNFGEARRYIPTARAIRLIKCTDHTQSQIVAPKDNDMHAVHCFWCGESYDEPHVYDGEGICECESIKEKYLDYDVATGTFIKKSHVGAAPIESSTDKLIIDLYEGWYIVSGDVSISCPDRSVEVMIHGDVHLILTDGGSLSVAGGIRVMDDDDDPTNGSPNNLTIYAQSQITVDENGEPDLAATAAGRLSVSPWDNGAGIGGSYGSSSPNSGAITINGGVIGASAGRGAGIGSGYGGSANVTINGGAITATSSSNGAGIGTGGQRGVHSMVTIRGGYINAASTNTSSGGAGIGGGYMTTSITVNISGGVINATGGEYGAGIGAAIDSKDCTVNITGGTITAQGGELGAGIGDGYRGEKLSITISNATVKATGGESGAGIGGGYNYATIVRDTDITISSGSITAQGGNQGTGIGGGYNDSAAGSTLDIKISGGDIDATAGERGTGIGSNYSDTETFLTVDITGGNIKAVGNREGAGIGGAIQSSTSDGANITVKNATLDVASGNFGAGIGGAYYGGCGIIKISDSVVKIRNEYYSAAIGEGRESRHSTAGGIEITNSDVSIQLIGSQCTGIGSGALSGASSSIEYIKLTGSTVTIDSNDNDNTGIGLGYQAAGAIGNIEITGGRIMMGSYMGIGIGAGKSSTGSVGDIIINPDPVTGNVYVSAYCNARDYAFGKLTDSTATVGDIRINGGTVVGSGYVGAFSSAPILSNEVEFNVYAGAERNNTTLQTPPIDSTLYTTSKVVKIEQTGSPEYVVVDITWGSMDFTYTDSVWNSTTHSWSQGGWSYTKKYDYNWNRITISNIGTAKISYSATVNMTVGGVSGTLSNPTGTLDVGYTRYLYLTLEGKPTSALDGAQIGTITISISKAE